LFCFLRIPGRTRRREKRNGKTYGEFGGFGFIGIDFGDVGVIVYVLDIVIVANQIIKYYGY